MRERSFYHHLPWDSDFFGIQVARLEVPAPGLAKALSLLKTEGTDLVYWSTPEAHTGIEQVLETYGGQMVVERLTMINRSLPKTYASPNVTMYPEKEACHTLLALGEKCGQCSRYYHDPFIKRQQVDALYRLWVVNSLRGPLANGILVYKDHHRIVGMLSVKVEGDIGYMGIMAVEDEYRGRGVGKALLQTAIHWFAEQGIQQAYMVTQQGNIPTKSLFEKFGFEEQRKELFYHFWLQK
ncbi:GNAT family N-acetyltransferase [Rapidithrix thailandica]|uniref:GNAT family N-acetyltransferase n=1 Tax=Rapidithrix thailandica TaxID=413964 RepID=A0AAW9RV00_9BACT